MRLAYKAFDKMGREVCGVIDAVAESEASEMLSRQGLFVGDINPANQAAKSSWGLRWPRSRTKMLRALAMLTRQLYSLMRSGTPLAQSLQSLEEQTKDHRWREVIKNLRTRVEHGSPLSEAMAAYPDYFDNVFRSMIAAGESSGKLSVLLERLATLTRKRVHILSTIRGAMTYPVLLACVSTTAITALLIFVVPKFAELFETLGSPVPPTTAALMSVSNFLRAYWWGVIPALAAVAVGVRFYLKSPSGKIFTDTAVLRLPKVGKIIKSFETARIARLLGILIESHLPIQDILNLTRDATSNVNYAALLNKASESVARGGDISSTFRDNDLIAGSAAEVLHTGEQSGQVGPLLIDLADFFDEENENTLKSLTSIIEPVLLVLMAVVVGFVAISIFMPLFDATGLVGAKH